MKDLDFDELDKAVSSLMKTATAVPPVTAAPSVETAQPAVVTDLPAGVADVPSAPTLPVVTSTPPLSAPKPPLVAAAPVAASTPAITQPLVQPKPGRFMDVMHPSADMRASQKTTTRPSRTGVTLAPLNQATAPEPVKTAVSPEATAKEPAVEQKNDDASWADPLDFQPAAPVPSVDKEPATTSSEDLLTAEEIVAKPAPNAPDSSSSFEKQLEQVKQTAASMPDISGDSEQTSPFLTDAKVEKRPLGSPVAAPEVAKPIPESTTPPAEVQPDTPKPKQSLAIPSLPGSFDADAEQPQGDEKATPEPVLPVELGKEITAIEADNPALHHTKAAIVAEPPSAASPTFITQQYKEKASSGDQEHAAIYDSNTQPLAHPAKKKSGWSVVIWIAVLITIGAGGAAAFYFLNII